MESPPCELSPSLGARGEGRFRSSSDDWAERVEGDRHARPPRSSTLPQGRVNSFQRHQSVSGQITSCRCLRQSHPHERNAPYPTATSGNSKASDISISAESPADKACPQTQIPWLTTSRRVCSICKASASAPIVRWQIGSGRCVGREKPARDVDRLADPIDNAARLPRPTRHDDAICRIVKLATGNLLMSDPVHLNLTAVPSPPAQPSWSDWLGVTASVGCAIHCARDAICDRFAAHLGAWLPGGQRVPSVDGRHLFRNRIGGVSSLAGGSTVVLLPAAVGAVGSNALIGGAAFGSSRRLLCLLRGQSLPAWPRHPNFLQPPQMTASPYRMPSLRPIGDITCEIGDCEFCAGDHATDHSSTED